MIFSISGKIGSGKDTVGIILQYLIYNSIRTKQGFKELSLDEFKIDYPLRAKITQFEIKKWAYKLKLICSIISGEPIERFEEPSFKDSYMNEQWRVYKNLSNGKIGLENVKGSQSAETFRPTYRWLLQTVGTEAMRNNIHPDIWINALMVDYKPNNETAPFPNWIITDTRFPNEAQAIKDKGGRLIRITRDYSFTHVNSKQHSSETALDDYKYWDYEIDNNGTIEELIEAVRKILIIEKII